MEKNRGPASVKIFTWFVILSVFFILLSAFTRYIFAKDYYFYIEAPCDPDTQNCYVRDCNDYCPPNELENYSLFIIKAHDFDSCTDNACTNICSSIPDSPCKKVACVADEETICSTE